MFGNLYLPSVMTVVSVKMLYFHRENVDIPHRKQKDGDDVQSSRHILGGIGLNWYTYALIAMIMFAR